MPKRKEDADPLDVIESMKARIDRLDAKIRKLGERFLAVDPEGGIDAFMNRVTETSRRLAAGLARQYVATEVSRFAGNLPPERANQVRAALIGTFDHDDEWWRQNADYEIGQWVNWLETGRWGLPVHSSREPEHADG